MARRFALPIKVFGSGVISRRFSSQKLQPEEIQVPVGDGSILAGRLWNKGGQKVPILALHGWLDNAGTWDPVAPLLSENHPLLSLDFPGSGFSTIGPGSSLHNTDLIWPIEKIREEFGWPKMHLLGHSDGAGAGMLYAATFPDFVEKLLLVDLLKHDTLTPDEMLTTTHRAVAMRLKLFKRLHKGPPRMAYTEQVSKLLKDYKGSLTEESAHVLLKRGLKKHEDGLFSTSVSPLLKSPPTLYTTIEQQKAFIRRLKCSVLAIKFSEGPLFDTKENCESIAKEYQLHCSKFNFLFIHGKHHMHMNDPHIIAPIVNNYITKGEVPSQYERTSQFFG